MLTLNLNLLYTVVNVLVLFLLLRKFLYKPVMNTFGFVRFYGLRLDCVRHPEQGLEPIVRNADIQFLCDLLDLVVIILYGGKIDLCRSIFAYIFYKDIELNFSPLQRLK